MKRLQNLNKWGEVILLLAMFVMFNSEVKADTTTIYLTVGGCDYEVTVDYTCSITAGVPSEYKITSYMLVDSTCTSSLSADDIARALGRKISDNVLLYITGCNWIYTPCPTYSNPRRKFEYFCWSSCLDTYGNVIHEPCYSEGGCKTDYTYCFNLGTGVVNYTHDTPVPFGSGNCPPIPQPPARVEFNTCYKANTECDQ